MDPALLRAAYDREAAGYDDRFRDQQRPKFVAFAALVPAPAPGARVVDLGGGTGLLREQLVAHDPAWGGAWFLVCDLSTGMLRRAAERAQAVVAADARALPLARASVARAFCVTGLVDRAHVERALVSVARCLVAGGFLGLSLRARDLPEAFGPMTARLPFDPVAERLVEGDRLFVLRRR